VAIVSAAVPTAAAALHFPRQSRGSDRAMEGTDGADELPCEEGGRGVEREGREMAEEGERERRPHQSRHCRLDLGRQDAASSSRPVCLVSRSKRYGEAVFEPFRAGNLGKF
jgi:hypothetical protein